MNLLDGLNDKQQEAVQSVDGPLLVLAGAGSGKTKTLTHRIAYLISEKGVWPGQILAVTFTNKAAREMRERLASILGEKNSFGFMPWMGTFHSICVRILRREGDVLGIGNNFVIYDEDDRQGLIKQAMKKRGITDKMIKARSISSTISSAKNEMRSHEDMMNSARYPNERTIAEIYADYESMRKKANALDFDDLLLEVVRLFQKFPEVRKRWRDDFKYILIDEYQDTNAAQYQIVKMLVNENQNICVVGDDWQSIYSWRGADFTNILNFEKDFPGAKVVKLEQNYRSTGAILDMANNVIKKNQNRTDKKLWTDLGEGKPVEITGVRDETEEASMVADRISLELAAGVRDENDFAVLYRTNAQSLLIERALRQRHLPYSIVGGMRFFDRAIIKDIIAYLRLVYQPNDRMSFTRIVNTPARGIGATSVEKFLAWHETTGLDIIGSLVNANQAGVLTKRAQNSLVEFGEMLRRIQVKMFDTNPADTVEYLIQQTKYREYIKSDPTQAEDKLENLSVLINEAATFADIDSFLEEVALVSSSDSKASDKTITLMTLHAAKGLEFPVVFMVGLEEGVFPHSRITDNSDEDIEEERRLCYVGMTRAKEELYISYASSRLQFGQRSYNMPSRFLADMGYSTSDLNDRAASYEDFYSDDFYSDELGLNPGDMVKSPMFGTGEVLEVDGLAVTVNFKTGTKKLNAEFARLEKIS